MVEYTFMFISALVIIVCVYFVVSPFFTSADVAIDGVNQTKEGTTIEAIYRAVNDLEMDYLMKKISRDDFLQMKDKYQTMAAVLLKEEKKTGLIRKKKSVTNSDNIETEILKELEAMRKAKERGEV